MSIFNTDLHYSILMYEIFLRIYVNTSHSLHHVIIQHLRAFN